MKSKFGSRLHPSETGSPGGNRRCRLLVLLPRRSFGLRRQAFQALSGAFRVSVLFFLKVVKGGIPEFLDPLSWHHANASVALVFIASLTAFSETMIGAFCHSSDNRSSPANETSRELNRRQIAERHKSFPNVVFCPDGLSACSF